jgi:uracil-DNA glycosylase family 4
MPSGDVNADIMFVGEAPGWSDNINSFNTTVYSYGQTSLLFRLLAFIVFGNSIWFTNISKAAIKYNKKLFSKEDTLSLINEIDIIKPRAIVALGKTAFDAVNELVDNAFQIYHPAYIARQGGDIYMYRNSMETVKNEIDTLV